MASSDAYSTVVIYKAVTGKTDTAEDTEILTDLKAVSRYIEGRLGRFFNKDAADATRIFIASVASPILRIDDLSASPTSIKIDLDNDGSFTDETALASTDFEMRPINAALSPEAWPFTEIYLTPWGTKINWSPGQRVQVIGKYGWPAVPDAIARATLHLTAILRLESPRATRRISEMEGTFEASREAQSIIQGLMQQYKAAAMWIM